MEASTNVMRVPRIEKVVVNIGVGEAGEKLIKAERVLEMVTKAKPSRTLTRTVNRDWGLREGMPVGCRVTLRGEAADDFLKRAFDIRAFKMPEYAWDSAGHLNFGVPDYTEFEGLRYDPEIGIFGMDVAVVIARAGARVRHRRLGKGRIPPNHRVERGESQEFMKNKFGLEVI